MVVIRQVIFVDIDGVLLPFPSQDNSSSSSSSHYRPLFPSSTLKPLQRLWSHVTKNTNNKNNNASAAAAAAAAATGEEVVSVVEWVLSSTWRVQEKFIKDIERALQEFGIPLEFSDITDPTLHSERQWEIYEWLQQRHHHHHHDHDLDDDHHHDDTKTTTTTTTTIHSKTKMVWLALDDEELLEGERNAQHRGLFQGHVVWTQSHIGLTEEDVDRAIQLWDQQLKDACG